MGLFGMFLKDELMKNSKNSLFQPRKWKKGNDIYGVRGKGNSLYDIEDKADIYDKNTGVNRSGFYHSYWRGWTEIRVDRIGKPYSIERVYTAPWIRQDLSTRDYVLVRILYGLLIALSVALFAFAMTRPIGSNYCWYVALFGMPSTILIFVVIWMFVCYAKAPRKMTLYEHKSSSVYLKRICLAFSIGLAATALSIVLFAFAMTRPIGSNYCWYVALFGMPSTILIFVVIWMFVCYAKAPRKMTLYEHKSSSVYLKRICLAFSIGLAATALSTVVYTVLNPGDTPLQQLLNVLLDLLAAGSVFAVFMLERKMKYVDIPNTNKPPAGGVEIR